MTDDWQRPKYQEVQEYMMRNKEEDYEQAEAKLGEARLDNRAILNFVVNIIKNNLVLFYRRKWVENRIYTIKVTQDLKRRNKAAFLIQNSFKQYLNRKNYRNNIILTKVHWEHIAKMAVKMITKAYLTFKFRKEIKQACRHARRIRIASTTIQRSYKKFRNRQRFRNRLAYLINQRNSFIRSNAALMIQKNYKMYYERKNYKKKLSKLYNIKNNQRYSNSVKIQRYWRKIRLFRKLCLIWNTVLLNKKKRQSARFIAHYWKNRKIVKIIQMCAREYRKFIYKRKLVKIQSTWRMYMQKKIYLLMRNKKIELWVRNTKIFQAALTLRKRFREFLARRKKNKDYNTHAFSNIRGSYYNHIVKIQSYFRMYIKRNYYINHLKISRVLYFRKLNKMALKIQCAFRIYLAKKRMRKQRKLRDRRVRMEKLHSIRSRAVTKIQRQYRRWVHRLMTFEHLKLVLIQVRYKHKHSCAAKIQKQWSKYKLRQFLKRKIADRYRGLLHQKATRIQKFWRYFKFRQRMRTFVTFRKQFAATTLQKFWRRYKAKKLVEKRYLAIYTIQTWWRSKLLEIRIRQAQQKKITVRNYVKDKNTKLANNPISYLKSRLNHQDPNLSTISKKSAYSYQQPYYGKDSYNSKSKLNITYEEKLKLGKNMKIKLNKSPSKKVEIKKDDIMQSPNHLVQRNTNLYYDTPNNNVISPINNKNFSNSTNFVKENALTNKPSNSYMNVQNNSNIDKSNFKSNQTFTTNKTYESKNTNIKDDLLKLKASISNNVNEYIKDSQRERINLSHKINTQNYDTTHNNLYSSNSTINNQLKQDPISYYSKDTNIPKKDLSHSIIKTQNIDQKSINKDPNSIINNYVDINMSKRNINYGSTFKENIKTKIIGGIIKSSISPAKKQEKDNIKYVKSMIKYVNCKIVEDRLRNSSMPEHFGTKTRYRCTYHSNGTADPNCKMFLTKEEQLYVKTKV